MEVICRVSYFYLCHVLTRVQLYRLPIFIGRNHSFRLGFTRQMGATTIGKMEQYDPTSFEPATMNSFNRARMVRGIGYMGLLPD
jgi:hypothetical protein